MIFKSCHQVTYFLTNTLNINILKKTTRECLLMVNGHIKNTLNAEVKLFLQALILVSVHQSREFNYWAQI